MLCLTCTGSAAGSLGVDIEFEKLLGRVFGDDFIEHFRHKFPSGYVDLMANFEARKRSVSDYQTTPSNVTLPFAFINAFRKWKGCTVEQAVKKFNSNDICYSAKIGMLRLQPSLIQQLFKPVTSEIVSHIDAVITNPTVPNIQYLFLVGGFSESQILQSAVRKAFESQVKVIIPQGVQLAILRGAVLFGLDPTVINIRRSRLTYGIGVLNKFIHGKHPRSKYIVQDGLEWCADVFDKFVLVDQSLGLGDCVTRSYTPAKCGQRSTVLHIYSSERDDVRYITDHGVQRCATLVLDLDSDDDCNYTNGQRREVKVSMIFGDTEFKVSAVDCISSKTVRAEICFNPT